MKLYYFPASTYSQKALIAFHETDTEFEPVLTNLFDTEAREKYRELYPVGKVPLLVLDNDYMIPESSIIIEYLDRHGHNGIKLIPDEPDRARQTRFKDRMLDLYLNNPLTTLLFQGIKPESEQDPEAIRTARYLIEVTYRYLDKDLADNTWLMGEDFTMADCSAAPPLYYARLIAPFDEYGNINAYAQRLFERPSYEKIKQEAQPYFDELTSKTGHRAA